MGPAFERSRFGAPLILLGLASFIIFPESLAEIEEDLQKSILDFSFWLAPFSIGTLLVLDAAPNYRSTRNLQMILGWGFICSSWLLIFPQLDSQLAQEMAQGTLVLAGFAIGLIAMLAGILLEEKLPGNGSESEPLSREEEDLVKTILERRIGGFEDGN